MPPPSAASAEKLTSRLFLGPALRTQSDGRLVTLVREGYEAAFEEIVRRYRTQLDRFAAAIVGGRSEDVTQDAFSKALLALRGSEAEIELRPWLYRIVRNTALNDLRDSPPDAAELSEVLAGGRSAAEEAESQQEMTDLMERLRALPEPQRAAIVMRELEGLSHEEIAAALGVSGGAARQAIFRARQALRDGLGLLLPLPLVRALIDHGAEAAGAGGAVAGVGAAGAAGAVGGTGAALGGVGVGGTLKVGVATALIAGSVGAGVAVDQRSDHSNERPAAAAETARGGRGAPNGSQIVAYGSGPSATAGVGAGESTQGRGSNDNGDDRQESDGEGHGRGSGDDGEVIGIHGDDRGLDHGGPGRRHGGTRHGSGEGGHDDGSRHDGRGPRPGGDDFAGDGSGRGGPGPGPRPSSLSGGSDSGHGGSGHSGGGGSDGSGGEGGSGSGSGLSGGSGGDGSGSGSGGSSGPSAEPPPEAPSPFPEGEPGDSRDGGEEDS